MKNGETQVIVSISIKSLKCLLLYAVMYMRDSVICIYWKSAFSRITPANLNGSG